MCERTHYLSSETSVAKEASFIGIGARGLGKGRSVDTTTR